MKNVLVSCIFCILLSPNLSFSQEYSYTHYDIGDGLAGSTLYCITQDKAGFIWMGTEAGVSRFDGIHFRNFTTRDGLPDLEILQIFGDSKGRVWMAPFRKAVCFYYNGKIHTAQNDPILSHIHLQQNVETFAEDARGNILIQEPTALHVLRTDGSVVRHDSLGGEPIRMSMAASASASGNFQMQVGAKIIEFSPNGWLRQTPITLPLDNPRFIYLNPHLVAWQNANKDMIRTLPEGRIISRVIDPKNIAHITYSLVDDSLVYSNEASGSTEYNVHTGQTRHFLPSIRVSRVFRDTFGNLWFTTIGQGLYRLNSIDMKIVSLTVRENERSGITSETRFGNQLWLGDDHGYLFRLSLPDMTLLDSKPFPWYSSNRILYIDTVDRDKIIAGSDYGLIEGTRDLRYIRDIHGGIKSAARIDGRRLLLGYSWGAAIFDLKNFRILDTLWRERATVVFYTKDTIYIGTLNGLYRSINGQPLLFLGDSTPFLRRRISSIAESSDGTLWIASYDDAGIIGYKDDRQTIAITSRQGLTSDLCRTLLVHNNTLWAGTDKGLNRISLDKPGYPITQFNSRDGLASDMINTLYADGSTLYVGTPAGLSFFDEKKMTDLGHCLLYLTSLSNGDRDRIDDTSHLLIPYTNKQVRFEFAGISYRSAGDVSYRYRMKGLDDTWRKTKQNFVEYPDLPAGNYEWQLIAINKFGIQSRLLTVPVEVTSQIWKRTWFIVTAWLSSLVLSWLLVSLRVRRIRRRQHEKERLTREMSRLENIALNSQMNPHFIFNCLNSIQQSIFAGDTKAANSYISGLARLIRMTLHNSSRSFVYIEDEIDYLSSYLELEKMRFKDKIDYDLIVDPTIDRAGMLIPPMLIQPYVENAIHHGLGTKKDGKGLISIRINKEIDDLIVEVQDNGVGRAASTHQPPSVPHDSKGMSLTEDRIRILKQLYERPFSISIADLKDNHQQPTGTLIVIKLPLFPEKTLYS